MRNELKKQRERYEDQLKGLRNEMNRWQCLAIAHVQALAADTGVLSSTDKGSGALFGRAGVASMLKGAKALIQDFESKED
jgi:hypothetical protein